MLTAQMSYLDGLRRAYEVARLSLDPSTQTGAVLVDPARGVLLADCNRFPKGVLRTDERDERAMRYRLTCHAEEGVILSAAAQGIRTSGLILVCPWAACCECAKAIIHSGVVEVVAHKELMDRTPDRWKDDISLAQGMFREAGVKYRMVTGVAGMTIRFDGKDIQV